MGQARRTVRRDQGRRWRPDRAGGDGSSGRWEVEERKEKITFAGPMFRCHFTVYFYIFLYALHRFEAVLTFMVPCTCVLRVDGLQALHEMLLEHL
jgi:hypothetical protein